MSSRGYARRRSTIRCRMVLVRGDPFRQGALGVTHGAADLHECRAFAGHAPPFKRASADAQMVGHRILRQEKVGNLPPVEGVRQFIGRDYGRRHANLHWGETRGARYRPSGYARRRGAKDTAPIRAAGHYYAIARARSKIFFSPSSRWSELNHVATRLARHRRCDPLPDSLRRLPHRIGGQVCVSFGGGSVAVTEQLAQHQQGAATRRA